MRIFPAGKVELDRCTFCSGLWFDGGELEALLGRKLPAKLDPDVITSRKCPVDSVSMQAAEVAGLRVEFCTKCHGVFLDDGELVALNGGKPVRIERGQPPAPVRADAKVQDDVMDWLQKLGA
jgi:Zn-finger nucleic acid-binding protein